MSDNTERDALTKLIYDVIAFHGGDPEHYEGDGGGICLDETVTWILAEFLPAHDERVREQTLRDFLSYRMLPSDVREYVSEYLNAGREASGD